MPDTSTEVKDGGGIRMPDRRLMGSASAIAARNWGRAGRDAETIVRDLDAGDDHKEVVPYIYAEHIYACQASGVRPHAGRSRHLSGGERT